MHTLNLRLSPDDIAWIANHAQDRFLIVDDILLPLYEQFRGKAKFEKVIVFPFSGKPVPKEFRATRTSSRSAGEIRLRAARRERPGGHVLHLGHHRTPKGRGVFAPLDHHSHTGGHAAGLLGPVGEVERDAGRDSDVDANHPLGIPTPRMLLAWNMGVAGITLSFADSPQ